VREFPFFFKPVSDFPCIQAAPLICSAVQHCKSLKYSNHPPVQRRRAVGVRLTVIWAFCTDRCRVATLCDFNHKPPCLDSILGGGCDNCWVALSVSRFSPETSGPRIELATNKTKYHQYWLYCSVPNFQCQRDESHKY